MGCDIGEVCGCLEGDVYLHNVSRSESNDDLSLPVPWIAVFFRAETIENANDNTNPNQSNANAPNLSVPMDRRSTNYSNNSNPNSTASEASGPLAGYDAILRRAHEKLEAIRFLSLVARSPEYSWRGNPRFWYYVLNNLCGVSNCKEYFSLPREPRKSSLQYREPPSCVPARDAGEVRAMPKFQVIFRSVRIKNELLELCAQAFSSTPNEAFQRVDQRVQDLLIRLRVAIPQRPRTVKIDFNFSHSRLRMMETMTGMQTLLGEASGRCETTHSPKILFKIRCLDLNNTIMSERDLTPLARILALPALAVSELKLNWVFTAKTSKRFMRSYCEFVATCFAVPLCGSANTSAGASLTRLCLDYSTLSDFQLSSLFSAVHESYSRRGVRELSLRGLEGNDAWLWLAFGIFHPESKSQIDNLDLSDCVLRLEAIELVRNLLESVDYGSYLVQKKTGQSSSHRRRDSTNQWVLLPVGTRLEIPQDSKKHGKGRSGPALKLQAELWCQALESGLSWTCVLVPAYGKVYVKNSNIIKTETRAGSNHNCKLKTLTMVAVNTSSRALRVSKHGELRGSLGAQPIQRVLSEWVTTVGQSLETLDLRDNPLTSRTLAIVLEACPLLTHLDVGGCELTDIAPITRAFRRESCILRTLKATQNRISPGSQEEFFQELGNPECAAVRHLQALHIADNPTSPMRVLNSTLLKNTTLRHLTLTKNERNLISQNTQHHFDSRHNGKRLGNEGLPLAHRLALLSLPTVKLLPTTVVEIVLDFARRGIYRRLVWE